MNAVAYEVQVIATGARAVDAGGKRELFTEETTTALVFENGGVLKLAAAVAPGQLLFLTHKESKREVVAQVTRKRDFRPTVCYVEVEFSEASPGFWGIAFPEMPAGAPAVASPTEAIAPQKRAERPESVELPELTEQPEPMEEDLIGDEPAAPTVAPSVEEVAALKTEVEALREQLKLLQTQTAEEAQLAEPSQVPVDPAAHGPAPAHAPAPPLPKLRLKMTEASQGPVTEISGAGASDVAAARAVASDAAETTHEGAEPSFSEEDLLPKPALNFDAAKPPKKTFSKPKAHSEPGHMVGAKSSSGVRKDLLFTAFVLVTLGAVWYENLLPWLPRPKFFGPGAAPSFAVHPPSRPPARTVASLPTNESNAVSASEAPRTTASVPGTTQNEAAQSNGGGKHDVAQPAPAESAKASTVPATDAPVPEKPNAVPGATADVIDPGEKPTESANVVAPAKKHLAPLALSKAAMVSPDASDKTGIVPPKLIKAVRAVASPNALQEFSKGGGDGVTFEAVVDTSGHVKPIKVLSGLATLQRAATEALKKYQYEPATRHGKPAAARVTVTVKFLFEP